MRVFTVGRANMDKIRLSEDDKSSGMRMQMTSLCMQVAYASAKSIWACMPKHRNSVCSARECLESTHNMLHAT